MGPGDATEERGDPRGAKAAASNRGTTPDSLTDRHEPSEIVRLRQRWRLFVVGIPSSLLVLIFGSLLFPSVRRWSHHNVALPLIADVLGVDTLRIGDELIQATHPAWVQPVFVLLSLVIVVSGWAALVTRRSLRTSWATRIRIDAPFLLATLPFIVVGVILTTLGTAQLFPYHIAFATVIPLIFLTVAAAILGSLVLALWVESAGTGGFPKRFILSTVLLFVARAALVESGLTTSRGLPWWGYVIPPVVAYATFAGITLGNRLVTHRRILFAFGIEQVAFAASFLADWTIRGPWPGITTTYMGNTALRAFEVPEISRLYITILPIVGFAFGMYTLGSFLHSYVRAARPWADGLNLALLSGQLLEGWVVTIGVLDPYDAGGPFYPHPGGWAGLLLNSLGGWGYVVAKFAFVLIIVHLIDVTYRSLFRERTEIAALLKGTVMALGLVPGLRATFALVIGI